MIETGRNSVFRKSPNGLDIQNEEGLKMTLRGLTAWDGKQHAEHLQRLSPEDRRLRFHSTMSDDAIANYSSHINWNHAYVFGVFVDGILRGVGELIPFEHSDEGELSISVERAWQKAGLGRILVRALILTGRRIGLKQIRMVYVRDNDRMRALAHAVGAESHFMHDVMEGVVSIQPPDSDPLPS